MDNEVARLMLQMRPALLVTVGVTLVVYLILQLCIRRLKIQGRGTKLAGLFVGLGGRSLLHLGTSWLKFIFLISCLVLSKPMQPVHYLLLLGLTLVTLVVGFSLEALLTELVGGGLILVGAMVCSTLLKYLQQIRNDSTILIAYWLLTVFLILCAAAVFLREVTSVSGERKYFDENGDTE